MIKIVGIIFIILSAVLLAPVCKAIFNILRGKHMNEPLLTNYRKCKGCGKWRTVPKEHQYKERNCNTPECHWILFHDGSQTEDHPNE